MAKQRLVFHNVEGPCDDMSRATGSSLTFQAPEARLHSESLRTRLRPSAISNQQAYAFLIFTVPGAQPACLKAERRSAAEKGATLMNNVESWGRWATLGLGLIAMLVGQIAALTAVIWWYGMNLTRLLDVASDGVVATLIICISTPVQILAAGADGAAGGL